ncbi:5-dehydro-2-deoxygluconokinase [Gordoniibacillus kamchatkensis]|uniref:5-dehydro-2-deoxygluconokinase n=1 Tax=Gordoniibacillus kamchatkensis TaxID=1590651 RepID=A0ABR5ALU8_9BACL|nr:5-dehydro-2-deoxygluconokinase [Paenibacillus sp. VKM B-2647]KIL41998.1 5-dehydro-2-deoxygluconokinase [Paenibacillus sp. VKM B-2647]
MKIARPGPGKALDLLAIGRLCIDLNANEIHRPMEETRSFTKYVGGSPANIAIAAARLGLRTGFIGRVSDDQFGRFIRDYLERERIDTGSVVTDRPGTVTGLAFTEILSPEQCSILMYREGVADLNLEPADVAESQISSARALLVSGTALARSPSREAVFRAVELARKHGVAVMFDIDFRPYTWANAAEIYTYCRLVAEKSDVIFGGREEFDLLERFPGETAQPAGGEDDATAREWLERSAELVVIKHGGRGSKAYARGGSVWQAGIFPAQVVKTFGAGDSFAGAFIYGLLSGWDIPRCLAYGSASASIVVSSHSCSDAMPTLEQIEQLLAKHQSPYAPKS